VFLASQDPDAFRFWIKVTQKGPKESCRSPTTRSARFFFFAPVVKLAAKIHVTEREREWNNITVPCYRISFNIQTPVPMISSPNHAVIKSSSAQCTRATGRASTTGGSRAPP
jgi:hypothetical protein